jgi:hypothetical protein
LPAFLEVKSFFFFSLSLGNRQGEIKVDHRDRLIDSRNGAVGVVSLVLAVFAAYKILTYVPISKKYVKEEKNNNKEENKTKLSDGDRALLTKLRAGCLPDIDHAQSRLRAHEANVDLTILVRIEPVKLLSFLDDTVHLFKFDVFLGAEEESVSSCRFLLQLSKELPILLMEPLLACEAVGMLEPIQEELVVQVITRVIGIPNLVFVAWKSVTIHADEKEVVRSKSVRPKLEVGQRFRPRIVAEYRSEREEEPRRLDLLHIVHAIAKGSPDTCAGYRRLMVWMLLYQVLDVVVQ